MLSRILFILFLCNYWIGFGSAGFRKTPQNVSVVLGDEVTLKCAYDSRGTSIIELDSQWRSSAGSLLGIHDTGRLPGHQGRYSYVKEAPEELDLKISDVRLDDDGEFECQMLNPLEGPIRAAAHLNVIVPPTSIHFENYQTNRSIEVVEGTELNVTCVAPNTKPKAQINWFINGLRVENRNSVTEKEVYHMNKTTTVYSSFLWRPRREDQKKTVVCEASQAVSGKKSSVHLNVDLMYPPDRPIVSIVGGDSFVRVGDNVTVVCLVRGGNPQPFLVSWYVNELPVSTKFDYDANSQESRNTYSFVTNSHHNGASFECHAQNRRGVPVGEEQKNALHFRVSYAPTEVLILGDAEVRLGADLRMQCRSKESNPAPKISWLLNGHPVAASGQQEELEQTHGIVSVSNLSFNSQDALRSGEGQQAVITCTAENDEGSVSKEFVINILVPPSRPKIAIDSESPHDSHHVIARQEGEELNLTCTTKGGNPKPHIAWYMGHEKISGSQSRIDSEGLMQSSISLTADSSMNDEKLRCSVLNKALDQPLIDSKTIRVFYQPRRLQIRQPEGVRHQLVAGKEATLLCVSSDANPPPSSIQWFFHLNPEAEPTLFNGETIINETAADTGSTLENLVSFTPTMHYDGIVVRCSARNAYWISPKNTTFPLNVMYAPMPLVESPIKIVVVEGESFKENLTVKANPPVSAWRWRKNGIPFEHTIGNVFARGSVLSGRNLNNQDAGQYTMFAINSVGNVNFTIDLTVEYSAKIIRISSPIIASEGDTVVLECEADGHPRKNEMLEWRRKGVKIASSHESSTRIVLRLNATKAIEGEYVCHADNGVGQPAESSTLVYLNSAPHVLNMPIQSKAAGPLGGKAKARCRAQGVPLAEFVWHSGSHAIKGNSSKYIITDRRMDLHMAESTLWIHNISPDNYQKELRCTAINELGSESKVIQLGPLTAPDVPLNVRITNTTDQSISIAWEPGFDGGTNQHFELHYEKYASPDGRQERAINTTHNQLRLTGLAPASTYLFQVRSINERGLSSPLSQPAVHATTLNEDGLQVSAVHTFNDLITTKATQFLFVLIVVLLTLCCCIILLWMGQKHKKRKLQEKTELVRANGDGSGGIIHRVQVYGATAHMPSQARIADGRLIEPDLDASEDEHSVRTMIEVNPNGCMQPITNDMYERTLFTEYDGYDPSGRMNPVAQYSTLGRRQYGTYANVPYPEPPSNLSPALSRGSLQRRRNNNNSPQPYMTTFMNESPRPGPIQYVQLEGDLV